MAASLVNQVVSSTDIGAATNKLNLLRKVETLPAKHLEKVRDNCKDNASLIGSSEFVKLLNDILTERDLEKLVIEKTAEIVFDDDIPF